MIPTKISAKSIRSFIWALTGEDAPAKVETPYMTADEAAQYLRITTKALYGLVERGKIKKLAGHRRYRFTRDTLDQYLRGE